MQTFFECFEIFWWHQLAGFFFLSSLMMLYNLLQQISATSCWYPLLTSAVLRNVRVCKSLHNRIIMQGIGNQNIQHFSTTHWQKLHRVPLNSSILNMLFWKLQIAELFNPWMTALVEVHLEIEELFRPTSSAEWQKNPHIVCAVSSPLFFLYHQNTTWCCWATNARKEQGANEKGITQQREWQRKQ